MVFPDIICLKFKFFRVNHILILLIFERLQFKISFISQMEINDIKWTSQIT